MSRKITVLLFAVSTAFDVVAEDSTIRSVEDGCADCTAAFQKLLNVGGEIRLPAGAYAVSKPLSVKGGTSIIGEPGRTRIRMDGDGNVFNGATGSGADIVDDDHFSGTGKLRVRKPCGTFIIVR